MIVGSADADRLPGNDGANGFRQRFPEGFFEGVLGIVLGRLDGAQDSFISRAQARLQVCPGAMQASCYAALAPGRAFPQPVQRLIQLLREGFPFGALVGEESPYLRIRDMLGSFPIAFLAVPAGVNQVFQSRDEFRISHRMHPR